MIPRISVLLARAARSAVVFRRGPSKQVLLLRWDLDKDELHEGQWLKGRIYERRCDLSPSGERLIYFAASQKPPYLTWTAVSRPPWLTALALWRKGDTWGGGGLFEGENRILLNHGTVDQEIAEGSVPARVKIGRFPGGGRGEDEPIESARRKREGWSLVEAGGVRGPPSPGGGWKLDPPRTWTRRSPRGETILCERLTAIGKRNAPWLKLSYSLSSGGTEAALGNLDWADWDVTGDLLFARDGRLFRLERGRLLAPDSATQVADLAPTRFTPRVAPEWARHWW